MSDRLTHSQEEHPSRVCAGLLRSTAEGTVAAEAALERWPKDARTGEPIFGDAWHVLYHFAADSDIRARDTSYAVYQRTLLESTADELDPD